MAGSLSGVCGRMRRSRQFQSLLFQPMPPPSAWTRCSRWARAVTSRNLSPPRRCGRNSTVYWSWQMPGNAIEQALFRATGDVLEKMFFASVIDDCPTGPDRDDSIAVRMAFDGERRGILYLRIGAEAARTLTGDFLGSDTE